MREFAFEFESTEILKRLFVYLKYRYNIKTLLHGENRFSFFFFFVYENVGCLILPEIRMGFLLIRRVAFTTF